MDTLRDGFADKIAQALSDSGWVYIPSKDARAGAESFAIALRVAGLVIDKDKGERKGTPWPSTP